MIRLLLLGIFIIALAIILKVAFHVAVFFTKLFLIIGLVIVFIAAIIFIIGNL